MVERLHVSPNRVRGGGYLLPPLGTTEFMKKGCLLSVQHMTVLEETRSVFIMNQADDTNLVISTSNTGYDYQMLTLPDGTVWYPYFENVHFEVDAVLTDADDIPVSGKNVFMIGSQATVDYQVTDSNGECSFYFNMGNTVYTVQAQFQPDSPDSGYVDAISNILNVQCGGCSIGLSAKQGTSTITTVGYKEAFSLEATVHDTIRDVDMNGVIVSFYNGSTLLGTATSNSNGVATLNNVKIITNECITAKIGDETSTELSLTVTRPIVTLTPDTLLANVKQRVKIQISVNDGNGHAVSGETVYFCNGNTPCTYARVGETGNDGVVNTSIYKTTEGIYSIYAGVDRDGLDIRTTPVNIEYRLLVPTEISGSVNPTFIQSGGTATLSALLTSTVGSTTPIPVAGLDVSFYEVYTPSLTGDINTSLIQSGDTATVTVQLKDADDGSLVRESGLTIGLYEELGPLFSDSSEHTQAYNEGQNVTVLSDEISVEDLTDHWKLSFDLKATVESRLFISDSTTAVPTNPQTSIFMGRDVSDYISYGYRTSVTNISRSSIPSITYNSCEIEYDNGSITYRVNGEVVGTKQYAPFTNVSNVVIGTVAWTDGGGTFNVKNILLDTVEEM